jgi:hypothetical protein
VDDLNVNVTDAIIQFMTVTPLEDWLPNSISNSTGILPTQDCSSIACYGPVIDALIDTFPIAELFQPSAVTNGAPGGAPSGARVSTAIRASISYAMLMSAFFGLVSFLLMS